MKTYIGGILESSVQCARSFWHLKRAIVTTTWVRRIAITCRIIMIKLEVGYYIHTCVKMRYKAAFRTQQILGQPSLKLLHWSELISRQIRPTD